MIHLSQTGARRVMLAAQGLDRHPERPATPDDVLTAIRRMGVLQIDTIHVVARSPYLVLWSRLGEYEPRWLDESHAAGRLFEYWAHAACFLPIEDWPLYRRLMLDEATGWTRAQPWLDAHPEVAATVLTHLREEGPVLSAAFERTDGRRGVWWDRKPEKMALEALFNTGDVMIARRHNFQRVYDLRERVLPGWNDGDTPSMTEVQWTLVARTVRHLGITTARWVPDYYRLPKRGMSEILDHLVGDGELLQAAVEGWRHTAYLHPDFATLARDADAPAHAPTLTTLLSPFDPLVWDRERASAAFGFDYRIECYTPAPQRRYGYFSLPILRRGELIGRLDAKAHRKHRLFEVKSLHLEPDTPATDDLVADLAAVLRDVAAWHTTPGVVVRLSNPPPLAERINAALPPLDNPPASRQGE